jgi:hypothetical protein
MMPQPDADLILERLRSGALEALIDICLDDLLQRPIGQLVSSSLVASRLVAALGELASSPTLEPWLREQLTTVKASTIEPSGPGGRAFPPGDTPRRFLPAELTAPVEELLAEPYLPDRELVLRLLDHEAMHSLIQEVLHASLTRFAQRMRSFKPDTSRLKAGLGRRVPGRLSKLKDLGTGMVSAVGSEIESQLDQRVSEFVSHAISAVLAHIATLLTAPERAETMGDWRAYGLRVVLDTELEAFATEARKLDLEHAVGAMVRAVRALAEREGLEAELEAGLDKVLQPWSERKLGQQLEQLGIEQAWRDLWRSWLSEQLAPVLNTTAFRAWLQDLLGADSQT